MQRLYSMFPAGAPGIALVFLRGAICTGLFLSNPVTALPHAMFVASVGEWVQLTVCVWLLLGIATPLAASIVVIASLAGFLAPAENHHIALLTAIDAIALALLGPGAYSIDARIFGRRLLVIAQANTGDDDRPSP